MISKKMIHLTGFTASSFYYSIVSFNIEYFPENGKINIWILENEFYLQAVFSMVLL
jgi:hypothetical protein